MRPPQYERPAPAREGVETHDGLMLRFTLGFGYGSAIVSASDSGDGTDITISALSGSFSIDLGGAVSENLVVHARISDLVMVNPSVSLGGTDLGEAEDTSLAAVLIGPALTYYVMPANIYLTAAVGLSWLTTSNRNTDQSQSTDVGVGVNADIGKEWWVSDDWGFGVAGRFWYTHATESEAGIDVNYDLPGFALLFSVTYQ